MSIALEVLPGAALDEPPCEDDGPEFGVLDDCAELGDEDTLSEGEED